MPARAPQAAPEEPEHWAYRRPVRPTPPEVRQADWVRTPIDRFILARLEKEGLKPSPQAPLETLVRRVSLDLIGLPPSPQEVDEVLADAARDGQDEAYARLVDELLASPHYGERWARPWLDLARYADSHGLREGSAARHVEVPRLGDRRAQSRHAVRSLHDRADCRRHAAERDAGAAGRERIPSQRDDQREGGIDPEEAHYEVLVDRVNTTATVWLGSTLGCAQCHNHKYDPFSQKDYYRVMAFFGNSDYEVRKLGDGTKFTETQIDLPTPEQEAKQKTIQAELDLLNAQIRLQTPALDRAQVEWEHAARLEPSLRWKVLAPKSLAAEGDVVLTPAPDGSIMASSANPGETTYTIEADAVLPRITAIRLEALPDPSLPKGGPGRDIYGNFQLNGVDAAAQPLERGPATEPLERGVVATAGRRAAAGAPGFANLAFKAIKSDDGGASLDSFFPKTLSRDLYAPRGWRIDASREDTRLPRQIVFTLDRPLETPAGARLRIRLKHQGAVVGQALGRFRLSVTSGRHSGARRGNPGEAAAHPGDRGGGSHRAAAQGSRGVLPDRRTVAEAGARSGRRAAEGAQGARHPDGARDARAGRLRAAVGVRAPPRELHRQGPAGLRRRAGIPAAARRRPDAEPPWPGALARRRGEPVDGARRGQPRVGAAVRPRPRRDERRLRHAGEPAVASRAPRLARDGTGPPGAGIRRRCTG